MALKLGGPDADAQKVLARSAALDQFASLRLCGYRPYDTVEGARRQRRRPRLGLPGPSQLLFRRAPDGPDTAVEHRRAA